MKFNCYRLVSAWFKENLPAVCEEGAAITPGPLDPESVRPCVLPAACALSVHSLLCSSVLLSRPFVSSFGLVFFRQTVLHPFIRIFVPLFCSLIHTVVLLSCELLRVYSPFVPCSLFIRSFSSFPPAFCLGVVLSRLFLLYVVIFIVRFSFKIFFWLLIEPFSFVYISEAVIELAEGYLSRLDSELEQIKGQHTENIL